MIHAKRAGSLSDAALETIAEVEFYFYRVTKVYVD